MTTSGGNGGSDDWGWSTEPGPEAQVGNGNPYEGNAPDTADTAAHATSTAPAPAKSGGKWKVILALLVIIPLGIAGAYFGINALNGSEDDGLYVESIPGADAGELADDEAAGSGTDSSGGSDSTGSGAADSDDADSTGAESADSDSSDAGEDAGSPSDDLRDAPSGGNDFAKPMSGQYSGEVSQVGIAAGARSATYAALIEIADDASTIDYPELNCSGRLVFEGMQGNKAVYREVLSEGVGRCDDGGTWWFSGSYHELTGRYVPASSRYESTGTFYRETWSRGDDTSEQW